MCSPEVPTPPCPSLKPTGSLKPPLSANVVQAGREMANYLSVQLRGAQATEKRVKASDQETHSQIQSTDLTQGEEKPG